MSPRLHRRVWQILLALLLGALVAWLIPSYFSAERYRHRLEAELERVLHRRVTFSAVSVCLLPRPGFVIQDAVIAEDPTFGSESFAHVERIECYIRWRALFGARFGFSRFHLEHPNINLVRVAGEGWNFERFLLQMSAFPSAGGSLFPLSFADRGRLDVEVENARINFKVGQNKKPFAMVDLRAQVSLDRVRNHLEFRLVGNPVRCDLPLPTPGAVEAAGEWTPGTDLRGPLDVRLRTRGALLYDAVPLVTGNNTTLYGVMDADARLTGSIRDLGFQGSGRVTDLHRWDQIPPSNPLPVTVTFRGRVDRDRGHILLEDVEAAFSESRVRTTGTIEHFMGSRDLDLVVALEGSRVEDLAALAGQVWAIQGPFMPRGRVEGMLAIRGPWTDRHYGGFVGARDVVLKTSSASFPVSDIAIRIDSHGARLAPVQASLAPHVTLEAEGVAGRGPERSLYDLALSVKAAPLREVVSLVRVLGVRGLQGWDAAGSGNASFHVTGSLGLSSHPLLKGRVELRSAHLGIPGFAGPVDLPRASILVDGNQIVVDRVAAVLGTSVFSGRFERRDGNSPWSFDLRTGNLDLEEGASWFVALGQHKPLPLLQRLRGLSSFAADRKAASDLFASLNASGQFSASRITYRDVTLKDFKTNLQVGGRIVQGTNAVFRAGEGRGRLNVRVDFTRKLGQAAADVSLSGVSVRSIAGRLPLVLRRARGSMFIEGHFDTAGLSSQAMTQNLNGRVTVRTSAISLAGFDPVGTFVRRSGAGTLEPFRGHADLRPLALDFRIHDRRTDLEKTSVECSGAKLGVSGTYTFGGGAALQVEADLKHLRRHWLARTGAASAGTVTEAFNFTGVLDKLAPVADPGSSGPKR